MIKNRIVQLINSEGLTSSKFADKIGVQRSSISHILSGRNKPSFDFIQKTINSFPHINVDWIITGNGEMYKQENSSLFDVTDAPEQKEEESPTYYPPKLKKETSKSKSTPDPVLEMNAFIPGKQIEKVVVFYTDKTFREYNPS